jgi:hypothetical protein
MSDYGAWIGATSKDELQGVAPDPNPLIACHECAKEHRYKDYWKPRYVEDKGWNPADVFWLCDECLDEMYRVYDRVRRGRNHTQLTEFNA